MTRKITETFIHYHLGLYHASPSLGKLLQPSRWEIHKVTRILLLGELP